ncbi:MAG: DUF1064 domain-containing protein [Thermoplasmatales archaeon]
MFFDFINANTRFHINLVAIIQGNKVYHMGMTLADYAKIKRKKSKYNATQIVKKDIRFDSKLEARYYDHLLREIDNGNISYFLRQVPFGLPGGIKYLVDFQIFMKDGTVRYVDVKGMMTDVNRNKIKQVVDLFPVTIEIVTKNEMSLF